MLVLDKMATATDAAPPLSPSTTSKRKKSFYAEEEDIVVKPSTELIPDEYEHSTSGSVLFHVFSTPAEKELAEGLIQSVQDIHYNVDVSRNLHSLDRISTFRAELQDIKEETANKSALILFFIGYCDKDAGSLLMVEETEWPKSVHVREVWNMFAANNCPHLKYKPKVFVFCTSSQQPLQVQTDSMRHRTMNFDKVYDFPAESDMLIVHKKVDDPWLLEGFIKQICDNVAEYSKKYDVVDLISYIHKNPKSVPLLVSTLTRKFYLTPNAEREHYLDVVENSSRLEETLERIQENVQKLHDAQKKKKEKRFFSFKKKSEDKPKVVKRKDKPIVEAPGSSRTDGPGGSRRPAGASSPVPRLSGGPVPGRRSRQPSVSEANQKKPIWKI